MTDEEFNNRKITIRPGAVVMNEAGLEIWGPMLVWTREIPIEPGYYWFQAAEPENDDLIHEPSILGIVRRGDGVLEIVNEWNDFRECDGIELDRFLANLKAGTRTRFCKVPVPQTPPLENPWRDKFTVTETTFTAEPEGAKRGMIVTIYCCPECYRECLQPTEEGLLRCECGWEKQLDNYVPPRKRTSFEEVTGKIIENMWTQAFSEAEPRPEVVDESKGET
jgi:hypothetical protein